MDTITNHVFIQTKIEYRMISCGHFAFRQGLVYTSTKTLHACMGQGFARYILGHCRALRRAPVDMNPKISAAVPCAGGLIKK